MTQVLGSENILRHVAIQFLLSQIPEEQRHEISEFVEVENFHARSGSGGLPKPKLEVDCYKIGE
jgi:hypothetical protein